MQHQKDWLVWRRLVPEDLHFRIGLFLREDISPSAAARIAAANCRRRANSWLLQCGKYLNRFWPEDSDREEWVGRSYGYYRAWLDLAERLDDAAKTLKEHWSL